MEKLPEQPPTKPARAGATLLHSVPASCISHVLSVLAALFPSSDTDWNALAAAAAAGKSYALPLAEKTAFPVLADGPCSGQESLSYACLSATMTKTFHSESLMQVNFVTSGSGEST